MSVLNDTPHVHKSISSYKTESVGAGSADSDVAVGTRRSERVLGNAVTVQPPPHPLHGLCPVGGGAAAVESLSLSACIEHDSITCSADTGGGYLQRVVEVQHCPSHHFLGMCTIIAQPEQNLLQVLLF